MIADARAPDVAHGAARGERTSLLSQPAFCTALVGLLADGRRHTLDALTIRLCDSIDARDRVVEAVDALRAGGMTVVRDGDAVTARAFAPLDAATLLRALDGWRVDVAGTIASTNTALLHRVRSDDATPLPALLASEVQRAGRGRLGRSWTSAPGVSLTASFALAIDRPLNALEGVTLACGLAVRDAFVDHGVDARLKWPNDLVVEDHKLAGVLVEAHARARARTTVLVIGVGVNVAEPEDVPLSSSSLPPISLERCGVHTRDRNRIAASMATAFARRLADFSVDGFAPVCDEWNACDAFRDRSVTLRSGGEAVSSGIARGVDASGALLLDADGRTTRVVNGDLSLRAAP